MLVLHNTLQETLHLSWLADNAADAGSDPFEGFEFNTQPESPM